MGVPGLWDILRPTGESHSLTKLAVQSGFVDNRNGNRAYRIGIDASIWFFHAQGGREGENPELRTLFFRCARLLAMPFLPIFVFDGPKRPKIKRGKSVGGKQHWMINNFRIVLDAFGFECRTAPGEAEAELAYLNSIGIIDAVLSDDVDCFLFGARTVMRNSSTTLSGNRNNGAKNSDGKNDGQHINLYRMDDIETNDAVRLSKGGLILIALLRGGDYDQQGIEGCGVNTAHALARAGLGDQLLEAALSNTLPRVLPTWRAAVRHELKTNASGFAARKSPTLAKRITDDFPPLDVLRCYTHPITSRCDQSGPKGLDMLWQKRADVKKIASACEQFFEWGVEETVVKRFRSFLWPGIVLRIVLQVALDKDSPSTSTGSYESCNETPSKILARKLGSMVIHHMEDLVKLVTAIHSERRHPSTGNILEYRLEIDPRKLVQRARSGIQGTRVELADSAAAGPLSDVDGDDEDEDGKETKRGTKIPADPDSTLRVWIPAVMIQRAYPELVEKFVAKKASKDAKKAKRGKSKKAIAIEEEEDDSAQSTPVKPKTGEAEPTKTSKPVAKELDSDDSATMSNQVAKPTANPTVISSSERRPASSSTSGPLKSRSLFELVDKELFKVSDVSRCKSKLRSTQESNLTSQVSFFNVRPAPRPFPMQVDDVFSSPPVTPAEPRARPRSRVDSCTSMSSSDGTGAIKKSPRKGQKHASPRKPSRVPSPSPLRPYLAPTMKPLDMATKRPATAEPIVNPKQPTNSKYKYKPKRFVPYKSSSKPDEVIVISSDSSDESFPIPKHRMHKDNTTINRTPVGV